MRYPDDWYEPTEKEAREAYSIAMKIREYIFKKINFSG
jgi:HEPN domain-containing protein